MHPKTRTDELVVTRVGDDLLIYDTEAKKAHALNEASAFVFEMCDGSRNVPMIAEQFATHRSVSIPAALAIVEKALEQLSHRKLLVQPVMRVTAERRVSRRQLLRQIATTAVAIPVIVSLAAPLPTAASSGGHSCGPKAPGATCLHDNECANCVCDPHTKLCH